MEELDPMNYILPSIKKLLGIPFDNKHFDIDLILFINTAFATLYQLGVGPTENAYKIENEDNVWSEFIGDNKNIENVKTYVFLKTKLAFDPPTTGAAMQSLKELIKESEWRLNVTCDPKPYLLPVEKGGETE